jgi:hypothetical protein
VLEYREGGLKNVMKMDKKEEEFDPDKYYEENVEPYIKSKGVQKVWNYFLEITKTDFFRDFVTNSREKYGIPLHGFPAVGDTYSKPEGFTSGKLINEIIEKICKRYALHYADYSEVIENYIYYNFLSPLTGIGVCGLFLVSDIIDEKEEPFGKLFQESDDAAYPIAIRISPYASQNDLVDFVKNKVIWEKEIGFLQNKYRDKKIRIGKVKAKNKEIEERNDFIYAHRDRPRKEIMKLLIAMHKKNPILWELDEAEISKIISLESRKRTDVSA